MAVEAVPPCGDPRERGPKLDAPPPAILTPQDVPVSVYWNSTFIAVVDAPFVYFNPSAALKADARNSCGPLSTAAVVTSPAAFTVISTTTVP